MAIPTTRFENAEGALSKYTSKGPAAALSSLVSKGRLHIALPDLFGDLLARVRGPSAARARLEVALVLLVVERLLLEPRVDVALSRVARVGDGASSLK